MMIKKKSFSIHLLRAAHAFVSVSLYTPQKITGPAMSDVTLKVHTRLPALRLDDFISK